MHNIQSRLDGLMEKRDAIIDNFVSKNSDDPALESQFEADIMKLQVKLTDIITEEIQIIDKTYAKTAPKVGKEDCRVIQKFVPSAGKIVGECLALVNDRNALID